MMDPNNHEKKMNDIDEQNTTNQNHHPDVSEDNQETKEVTMNWEFPTATKEEREQHTDTPSVKIEQQDVEIVQRQPILRTEQKQVKSKPKYKSFLQMVAAGIVGSVLTLTVAPFADGIFDGSDEVKTVRTVSPVKTEPTAVSTSNIADVVEEASKAIVGIVNLRQAQVNPFSPEQSQNVESGTGSGVIFKVENNVAYIVTNNHVVEGANELEVSLYNGEKTKGKLIGADALTDLAVIKIDANHVDTVLTFGDSDTLRPGEQVLAIGNPLGLDLSRTVTQGIVSAVDRTISVSTSAGEWDLNVIQTDAAINPGNSGGALINTQGQVIGINSLKISSDKVEGLGFAIPSNDAVPIINEIIEKGHVERPFMGIGLANLEDIPQMYYSDLPRDITQGIIITSVQPGSAAEKAGLRIQDVIVKIDGKEVKTTVDLRKYLYTEVKVGDEIEIEFYRNGQLQKTTLVLTSSGASIN